MSSKPRIDMHAHFYGGGLAEALRRRTERPYLRPGDDGREFMVAMNAAFPFTPAYHDHRVGLAQMDAQGLTHRMLTFPGALGVDVLPAAEVVDVIRDFNSFMAGLRTETGGRLVGLAGLPLADMPAAVAELNRIRRDLRLPGAILPSNYLATIEAARELEPLLKAANETGAHLMIHPGLRPGEQPPPQAHDHPQYRTSAVELQSQAAQNVLTLVLSDILDAYPRISFQVVNLGGTIPFIFERMERIGHHRNPDQPFPTGRLKSIWYDCASLGPNALACAVQLYGAERIFMGSDFPIFRDDPFASCVAAARLSEREIELIAGGNAMRLLDRLDG